MVISFKDNLMERIENLVDKKLQVGLSKKEQQKLTNLWGKFDHNSEWREIKESLK